MVSEFGEPKTFVECYLIIQIKVRLLSWPVIVIFGNSSLQNVRSLSDVREYVPV